MRLKRSLISLMSGVSLLGLNVIFIGAGLPLIGGSRGRGFAQVRSESDTKTDTARYKKYQNEHYSFSFEYPAKWLLSEALDGNGVSISPVAGERSRIAVSGSKVASIETHFLSLEEHFDASLRSLQKKRSHPEHHPQNVVLVKKEVTTVLGLPAIVSTIEFDKDGQNWIEHGTLVHSQDGSTAYDIAIDCHPEELQTFQSVYDRVVQTFRILGPPK